MKFSIIVPCYNLAPWIRQCLDSVLEQDCQDWECVVVDDESNDGSRDILDEYAIKDSRFVIIHQKNAGEGGARNTGLSKAKGEWVFFLDGDDLMLPNTLSSLADCISKNDNVIRFDFCEFNDGERPEAKSDAIQTNSRLVDISNEIKMSEFFTYVWQHVYRRSIIDGIQFKRYKRGCDRAYLSEVLLNKTDSVKVVDIVGYGYRKRAGSAMNTVPSRQVLLDEMDHRLDIMEMIDKSCKSVHYANNAWLEKYFTTQFYHIVNSCGADKQEIVLDWRNRLHRLKQMKGLSYYGRFVALSSSIIRLHLWDALVCYVVPRFIYGGSPIRWVRKKLKITDK